FGSQTVEKRMLAADLVTVLARLLTRHGNRVGALLYSDRVEGVIPARSVRRQVLHLLDRMTQPVSPAALAGTDLKLLTQQADDAAAVRRRARLRLHPPGGLGAGTFTSRAAPRDRCRAPLRSAGGRAAGPGPHRDAGRGNRRAALRGYARCGLPAAVRRERAAP